MSARFRIEITGPSTPDLVNRLRNLGEDLQRALGVKAHVDMTEVDAAREFFCVLVSHRRNLGDVAMIIKKQVANSGQDGVFSVLREKE